MRNDLELVVAWIDMGCTFVSVLVGLYWCFAYHNISIGQAWPVPGCGVPCPTQRSGSFAVMDECT